MALPSQVTPIFLFKALRHQAEEEGLAEESETDLQTLAGEVARLREDLAEVPRRLAAT